MKSKTLFNGILTAVLAALGIKADAASYPDVMAAPGAAAGSGDTVNIAAGTHTEAAAAVNRNITVKGAGADNAVIQAATAWKIL
jgi:hypothetical protein